jgi:hypothetical protein
MATINASSGQILNDGNSSPYTPSNPYNTYVSNMGNLLSYITKTSSAGNAAMIANNEGITRGESALATPDSANNPLNGLYAFMPGSARTGVEATMGNIMEPAKLSNAGQAASANQTASSLQTTVSDQMTAAISQEQQQIAAYNATKPNWTLSPTPNADGEFYYYNTNTPAGQPTQVYAAGKIPPGSGGSPGGSPGSAGSTATLAASHNPYGIKMTSTTTDMFSSLGATPGPGAVDGGNFWSFPDDSTGEKAARTLFTSSIYANDSVDQALKQWSNYTGKGDYPGYNGSILAGTGIDPNAMVKSLSSVQVDAVMAAMKKAEAVGNPLPATDNSTLGKIATVVASGALTYDQGVAQIEGAYGSSGGYIVPNLLPAIKKINPSFDPQQSNAQGAAKVSNTKLAGDTAALVEKTNGTLDMLSDAGDKLPFGLTTGSGTLNSITGTLAKITGADNEVITNYNSLLQEARAGLQAVLNSAAGLGVVTGGVTAESILPDGMSNKTLKSQIAIARKLEENTKTALANLANASPTTQPINQSTGGDYATYLKSIGVTQ